MDSCAKIGEAPRMPPIRPLTPDARRMEAGNGARRADVEDEQGGGGRGMREAQSALRSVHAAPCGSRAAIPSG